MERYRKALHGVIDTFDVLQVGCDDEHHNIDAVEQLAPVVVDAGLRLRINVLSEFCSSDTRQRILAIRDRYEAPVSFSALAHDYRSLPVSNRLTEPCTDRMRQFLLDCNGNAYFCSQSEMEDPIFNLHSVEPDRIEGLVYHENPASFYRFCECCEKYRPQRRSRSWTRLVG
jgi:hypothetical protein